MDGRVAFASSEERYDRVRHSGAFPERAARDALATAGVAAREVDAVAFPWTRGMARLRKALHVLRGWPRSRAFLREAPDPRLPGRGAYLRAMAGLEGRVRALLGRPVRVARVPHHEAHAASAALVLPDARGAVLTADGMGEWTTAAVWDLEDGLPARIAAASYPHSPGKAYAAVTAWLGFAPESDEGKTMGLAAWGDPSSPRAAFTRGLLAPDARRLLRVRTEAFGFPWGEARLWGDEFLRALGPPRRPDEPLRPGDADAARGIQDAVEAFALHAARAALARTGRQALGLAGGLFLNCAANGVLHRALGGAVFPCPVAGDAGAALGAAALLHRRATGRPAAPLGTLRLGGGLDDAEAAELARSRGGRRLDPAALAAEVARCADGGGLVAVARGRGELGPRALGGRSVLARADDPSVRDRLNDHKGRERWRPLAPVLREQDAPRWFDPGTPSPWMILTLRARPAAARPLGGAVHADGTARVQTVTPSSDPFLHAVLDAMAARGHAAVLNTSLNRRGEPIVRTASEALEAATAMRLDAAVLGDWWVPLGRAAR